MINSLTSDETFNVIYFVILLALFASSMIARMANRPIKFLKDISIWLAVVFVLVLGYSYRYEFSGVKERVLGELSPARANISDDGSVSFRVARDGHYHIIAKVNGEDVEFMLDTGASDVVINRSTAKRLGINVRELEFTKIYNTANGTVKGAPIRLDSLEIGDIKVKGVRASVNDSDLDTPLLGMSFLEKLGGYEVKGGVLRLWW
jgi:aspartyl protease family protein